jgi:hypothetical protein
MMSNNQYDVPLTVPEQNAPPAPAQPAPAAPAAATPAPTAMEPKAKRVATETQLRALAAGRKKQMEAREAAKKAAEQPSAPAEEPADEEVSDQEEEEEPAPRKTVRKTPKQEKTDELIDWAQREYYQIKLQKLKQKMEEEEAMARYKQAPTQQHLADVAKHELRKKLDAEAFNRAYMQLFGESYSLRA